MNRRKFLKYAGATGAIVGASALGLDYVLSPRPSPTNQAESTTSLNQMTSAPNHPPRFLWPPLNMKPRFILPTPQYTIELSPNAADDDNDPLSFTWSVDGKEVSHENIYLTKLPEGDHEIDVTASDGQAAASSKSTLAVEPDQIYPMKPLNLRYKGVRYFAGTVTPEWDLPSPSGDEMDEELDTIQNELGCNAIAVCGGGPSEDRMIECGRIAIDKGFRRIFLQPSYVNSTVDETIDSIGRFAENVKSLRETSEAVVYMVGHEFQLETAIIRGSNYWDRWANANKGTDWDKVRATLPRMFNRIIDTCRSNYGYPISYAATPPEAYEGLVPWENPAFESVGIDAYIHDFLGWNEDWILRLLDNLKRFRKPVHCADFGMMSYEGADKYGGWNPLYATQNRYDEEPQARFTKRTLDMLNRARIDGCFWVQYNDHLFERGHALVNPITRKRKKGFYMYRSYERVM